MDTKGWLWQARFIIIFFLLLCLVMTVVLWKTHCLKILEKEKRSSHFPLNRGETLPPTYECAWGKGTKKSFSVFNFSAEINERQFSPRGSMAIEYKKKALASCSVRQNQPVPSPRYARLHPIHLALNRTCQTLAAAFDAPWREQRRPRSHVPHRNNNKLGS